MHYFDYFSGTSSRPLTNGFGTPSDLCARYFSNGVLKQVQHDRYIVILVLLSFHLSPNYNGTL